jgi:hypothetical protein
VGLALRERLDRLREVEVAVAVKADAGEAKKRARRGVEGVHLRRVGSATRVSEVEVDPELFDPGEDLTQ